MGCGFSRDLAKQFRFHSRLWTRRFGSQSQKVDGLSSFANAREALRTVAPQVIAEIQRVLLRERAEQPEFVEFF
jgi:hypothetical protein